MSAHLIDVSHLRKRYGESVVVDDVSFHIAPGECLGVIGPNGAGKTTTIRMALGLAAPDGGEVAYTLDGTRRTMPGDALAISPPVK